MPVAQLADLRDVPATAGSPESLQHYERALFQRLTYRGGTLDTIEQALGEDPEFVMGHCLRAYSHRSLGNGNPTDEFLSALDRAAAAAEQGNDRERAHVAGIRAWSEGQFSRSIDIVESILLEHPRDLLALQVAHMGNFYIGQAQGLRDSAARVLPSYDESVPGCGSVYGMLAFGLEECNEYGKAEEFGRRAVELNRSDVWAMHAVAHVMEMQGRREEGIQWYRSRKSDWTAAADFRTHNYWHYSLYHLDLGDYAAVLDIYDEAMAEADEPLELIDAGAILWRLHLLGVDTANRWQAVADKWEGMLPRYGFYSFNDCHSIVAFVGSGRLDRAQFALRAMSESAGGSSDSASIVREVGLPVAEAFVAFGEADYGRAAELLASVRDRAHRFGGSHAQRDILARTLIESAIRSGNRDFARTLICERRQSGRHIPPKWRCAL